VDRRIKTKNRTQEQISRETEKDMKITQVDTNILNKLLELSEALKAGDHSKRIVAGFDDDIISRIISNLNKHTDNLFTSSSKINEPGNFDVSTFIDVISSFANHDFSHKIPISEHGTILDAIATGINMLGDELEQSVVSKQELEKERNQLTQAQSIARIGNWEYNLLTKKISGSDELYRIYELDERSPDILAKAFYKKYHPDDIIELRESIKYAELKDRGFDYEHRLINDDKSIKYLAGICETVKNEQGKIIGIKGIVQDITDRKNAEIELNNSFRVVTEQNKRLLNFSYIVSHNLRSHASNIHSLLNLLGVSKTNPEREELMKRLKTVSGLLNETMDHLREIVTVQSDAKLSVRPLNVYDYVNQAIDLLSDQVYLKKAIIKNNVPRNLVISYNPAYLESIILNFLSNALRYCSPNRQCDVLVDYLHGKSTLQITDNGIGIDLKKYGDKLFGM
jgi:signal transduction histidine kinase